MFSRISPLATLVVAAVLGNERVDVLAGSAEIRATLIMDLPAAVQEMLTATRTEALYTLDLLKENNVVRGYGR